jgi:2-methylcitrate dehydratase
MDALDCINIALLAREGMTGPIAVFEGPKGFQEVFDMKLDYDWKNENFELVKKCALKRYNAEVHSQPSIHAALELKRQHGFDINEIEKITVTTFLTAYHIIGSGAYGDRKNVHSKEQADHSLHYLIAVALVDDDIYPEQFTNDRINRADVQDLLKKVSVTTKFPVHKPVVVAGLLDPYTQAYPDKMKTKVEIDLRGGKILSCEKSDYPGFFTTPLSWEDVTKKFKKLSDGMISGDDQAKIIELVNDLENRDMTELLELVNVKQPSTINAWQ